MAKKKPKKHPGGRPTKMTPEVVQILKDCFEVDCTVEEACRQARIAKQTYYDECKRNPKFADEMSRAQDWPLLAAKQGVFNAIRGKRDGYGALALKFLERRQRDRYTPKLTLEHEGGIVTYDSLEGQKKAKTLAEAQELAEELDDDSDVTT